MTKKQEEKLSEELYLLVNLCENFYETDYVKAKIKYIANAIKRIKKIVEKKE